jgi:hypothetical protein
MASDAIVLRQEMDVTLSPVMDLAVAKQRMQQFQSFVKDYLVKDEDFGTIPGTPKPTLYKPGADKLCELYGLADDYAILDKIEDFDKGLFDYNVKCILTSKRGGFLVATGLGSCNSYEGRYRWRDAKPKCPNCGKESIFKSKDAPFGYFCWAKKGGCGAQFPPESTAIANQDAGKVLNDDVATLKNTILKMAKKRAKVDATLSATRSSGIFTQDVEDFKSFAAEPEAPESHSERATAPTPTAPTPNAHQQYRPSGKTITDAQQKRFFAIANGNNLSKEDSSAHREGIRIQRDRSDHDGKVRRNLRCPEAPDIARRSSRRRHTVLGETK